MMQRVILVLSALVLIVAVLYYWPATRPTTPPALAGVTPSVETNPTTSPARPGARSASAQSQTSAPHATPSLAAAGLNPETDFPIVAPLNAPGSTVQRDLDVISQLFEAWLSNFPREGNPVGENVEITAALMGENRLALALIPKGHRAVNEQGELCDRWGTPFRFHQLSGTRMEVRSAGPDRRFATEDDAVWTPQ